MNSDSKYLGRSIRDSGIREEVKGLIVGIERNAQRILNPDSALTLQEGDLLWIVGDQKLIRSKQI
ncbi:MAG: cation:proton antiporter regulatory subunit [Pseudobdellovibrionaceae bacterium]